MFGTFRRHQNWIMLAVAAVVIVTFIAYFNPASKSSNRNSRYVAGDRGTINGHAISEDELQDALHEVVLGHYLNRERIDPTSAGARFEAYQALFLADKEDQLGIHVTAEGAAAFADQNILAGRMKLKDFVEQILKPVGLTEDDFARFLRHQAGLRQLMAVAGIAGSVMTPAEAEVLYVSQTREVASSLVYFPYTNYLNKVTNTEADIAQYFTNNVTNYVVPEKVAVSYVKFNATNYFADAKAAVTNLEQIVTQAVEEAGTNLPVGAKTPEEAKAQYRELILNTKAEQFAAQKANDFAMRVDAKRAEAGTNALEAQARSEGLTVSTTTPFDMSGPEGMKVPAAFALAAFQLTPDMPFSGRIPAEDGAYVLGLNQRIPPKTPTLSEVHSKVVADYKEEKAREMALDAAASFSSTLESQLNVNNGVTLPKDFATIAAENNLKVETVPPLSIATTNIPEDLEQKVGLSQLRRVVFGTAPGSASKAQPAAEGAVVLYVDKALPIDISKLQAQMPRFLAGLRKARQEEAFKNWMFNEMNRDPGVVAIYTELQKENEGPNATAKK